MTARSPHPKIAKVSRQISATQRIAATVGGRTHVAGGWGELELGGCFTVVPGLDTIDYPKFPALGANASGAFLVWLHQQPIPSTMTDLQGLSIVP
jgi:hypothetical protein